MSEQQGIAPGGSRRRIVWIAVAIAVVVLVIGGIIWYSVASSSGANNATPSASATPTTSATPSATPETATPSPSQSPVSEDDSDDDAPSEPTERAVLDPVPLDQPAAPIEGLSARIVSVEAFDAEAAVPGEVAGPALRVSVSVENTTGATIGISGAIANMYYTADRTPANILVSPREDLPLEVAAGETVTGVYAFTVPADQRSDILIELDLSLDLPVVLFQGAV